MKISNDDTLKFQPFYISATENWIKIFSQCLYPFIRNHSSYDKYAPYLWQTIWTNDFTKPTFDTTIEGKHYLLAKDDTTLGLIPVKCDFHYKYKLDSLPNLVIVVPGNPTPIPVKGTKVVFESYATIKEPNYKFERLPDSVAMNSE
ncbi:MAG: hypothetical protein N2560_03445 [Ignavibacteria bacterium]|nr:hypothetical protein [Ignavibacteria bacterium]